MNNGDLFGSPVFLIIYCGTMKVTHKSGRTFDRIQFARDSLKLQKIGLIRARSSISTARKV